MWPAGMLICVGGGRGGRAYLVPPVNTVVPPVNTDIMGWGQLRDRGSYMRLVAQGATYLVPPIDTVVLLPTPETVS